LSPSIGDNAKRNSIIKDYTYDENPDENFVQSDLVKMAFELPYMPEEVRTKFRFNDEGYH